MIVVVGCAHCATRGSGLCAARPGDQGRPVRAERSEPRSGALDGPGGRATREVTRSRLHGACCWLLTVKRLAREDDMRVSAASSRLLRLDGIWVRKVRF